MGVGVGGGAPQVLPDQRYGEEGQLGVLLLHPEADLVHTCSRLVELFQHQLGSAKLVLGPHNGLHSALVADVHLVGRPRVQEGQDQAGAQHHHKREGPLEGDANPNPVLLREEVKGLRERARERSNGQKRALKLRKREVGMRGAGRERCSKGERNRSVPSF